MRTSAVVQIVVFLVVIAALVYVVLEVSSGWADWIVLGVIVCAVLGAGLAAWNRQYPYATKKRRFTRPSEDEMAKFRKFLGPALVKQYTPAQLAGWSAVPSADTTVFSASTISRAAGSLIT